MPPELVVADIYAPPGICRRMARIVRASVPVLLVVLIVAFPAVAASTPTAMTETSPAGEPSFIFMNGEIVTVDPKIPVARALMVRGARIQAVGSSAIVQSSRAPGTTVIDLAGHALVPGFIDGHTHLLQSKWLQGKSLEEVTDVALRYGVTTIQEVWADEAFLGELFEAERQGELRLRVNAFPVYNAARLDDDGRTIIREEWFPAHDPILDAERMLRIPGIKIYADGGGGPPRGCPALTEPWAEAFRNDPSFFCFDERGDLYLSQEQLNRVVAEAQDAGFRVAIHAVGDRAIDTVLNAIEHALKGQSNDKYRHQIHHNSLLRPDQLPRYVDLRMVASVRGYGPTCWQELNEFWYGPDRLEWVGNRYALPSLGVHAFAEGDFSWTNDPDDRTFFRPINPILSLYGLVTRKQLQADGTTCDPPALACEA